MHEHLRRARQNKIDHCDVCYRHFLTRGYPGARDIFTSTHTIVIAQEFTVQAVYVHSCYTYTAASSRTCTHAHKIDVVIRHAVPQCLYDTVLLFQKDNRCQRLQHINRSVMYSSCGYESMHRGKVFPSKTIHVSILYSTF